MSLLPLLRAKKAILLLLLIVLTIEDNREVVRYLSLTVGNTGSALAVEWLECPASQSVSQLLSRRPPVCTALCANLFHL